MPKGYVVFTVQVNDQAGMDEYVQAATPIVYAAGGNLVVAGPPEEVIEGTWFGNILAILEFPSVEAAREWYQSADYRAIIGKRHGAAETNAAIFAGFEMPTG
jgi:uncharacterized protein (DUF1330 family)